MSLARRLHRLADIQRELRRIVADLDEEAVKRQYHPDLSPLGWHLGHCAFIELFWLGERVLGEPAPAALAALYFPEISPKPRRGGRLPERQALLDWSGQVQARTLTRLGGELPPHPLLRDDYLLRFLLQHHAQHLEIMRMALCQRVLAAAAPAAGVAGTTPLRPQPRRVRLPAGEYLLGTDCGDGFDNEQPPRPVRLEAAELALRPASNADYLAFMDDGGYRDRRWWCEAGWRWLSAGGARAPAQWLVQDGQWWEAHPSDRLPLRPEQAVLGLNWFEAGAFARWAGGRLPHEYEWEAAQSLDLLAGVGESWEWCGNRFHPYPGFRAFPYDGYSLPWFDGRHFVLRGSSRYSEPEIRRRSFRNFYEADKRHILAGVRPAFDAD